MFGVPLGHSVSGCLLGPGSLVQGRVPSGFYGVEDSIAGMLVDSSCSSWGRKSRGCLSLGGALFWEPCVRLEFPSQGKSVRVQ